MMGAESYTPTQIGPIEMPVYLEHFDAATRQAIIDTCIAHVFKNVNPIFAVNESGEQVFANPIAKDFLLENGYESFDKLAGNNVDVFEEAKVAFENNPKQEASTYFWVRNERAMQEKENQFTENEVEDFKPHETGGYYKVIINAKAGNTYHLDVKEAGLEIIDALTGAYNSSFMRYYETRIDKMLETGKPIVLIDLDVDDMKGLNDIFRDHSAGDDGLKQAALILRKALRDTDPIFRGGIAGDGEIKGSDEFYGVILGDKENEEALTGEEIVTNLTKRLENIQEMEVERRNKSMADQIDKLPPKIATFAVVSSDSDLFNPERDRGISLTFDILRSVGDHLMYAKKEAGKISRKLSNMPSETNDIDRIAMTNNEIFNLLRGNLSDARLDYYNQVTTAIKQNVERLGLNNEDMMVIETAILGHEIGTNQYVNRNSENSNCERIRVPYYSKAFFDELHAATGIETFKTVGEIVYKHHASPEDNADKNGRIYPEDISLDIESNKKDKMANLLNILDTYYSMCFKRKHPDDTRPVRSPEEAITAMLNTTVQFNPELVTACASFLPTSLVRDEI